MAETASLKRLGGGRWQSRDGRFTIEPQSGTWVVVDGERTNELGLPLVRGPFPSLTAARADIEAARAEGDASSPLAERIAATPRRSSGGTGRAASAARSGPKPGARKRAGNAVESGPQEPEKRAEREPEEPAWLRSLDGPRRNEARRLIARLSESGIEDAVGVVRSDLVGDQPALARLAIARRIFEAIGSRRDPEAIAQVVADALVEGDDRELGVKWRLMDGKGRAIARLDLPGAKRRKRSA